MKKNTQKLKILICGYYGFGNLGDELILNHICHTLRSTKNTVVEISVLSSSPKETARTHKVKAFNRRNLFAIFFAIARSNVFLLGGGGLIQDKTSSASLYYYLILCLFAKIFGKKVVVFAVGANPLKKLNRIICAWILNMTDGVMLRDKFSYDYLKKIGVRESNLTHGVDPVFAQTVAYVNEKTLNALFILRQQNNMDRLETVLASFSDYIVKKTLGSITFGYFQKNDFEFCENITKLVPSKVDHSMPVEFTCENLNMFAKTGFVVTQRYHGAVLAIKAKIPFIILSDDKKLIEIAREFSQFSVSPSDLYCYDRLTNAFDELWQNYDTCIKNLERGSTVLEAKIGQNAEFLYRCVNLI